MPDAPLLAAHCALPPLPFLFDLVLAYTRANAGQGAQPLALEYWRDDTEKKVWQVRFVQSAQEAVRVFVVPQGMDAGLMQTLGLEVGELRSGGYFEVLSQSGAQEDALCVLARAALQDLSEPCTCLASDLDLLRFYSNATLCVCGRGWAAAAQRARAASRGRCAFTGQVFGEDGPPMHPAWTRWIAERHALMAGNK
jgi:hypothetical protein